MMARNEADVVLVVGARLREYDGWGKPPAWGDPARQTTSQIQALVAMAPRANSRNENSGTNPGASLATLAAGLAGKAWA